MDKNISKRDRKKLIQQICDQLPDMYEIKQVKKLVLGADLVKMIERGEVINTNDQNLDDIDFYRKYIVSKPTKMKIRHKRRLRNSIKKYGVDKGVNMYLQSLKRLM